MARETDERAKLEAAKRASFGQVLVRAARLWNEAALARLRTMERYAEVRAAHLALFPHLDWEGIRLTELASRLGVTKQAVQPLVDDLERMGLVERVVDPADARSRLVRLCPSAAAAIGEGLAVLATIERDVESELGAGVLGDVLPVLGGVADVLEKQASARKG